VIVATPFNEQVGAATEIVGITGIDNCNALVNGTEETDVQTPLLETTV